MSNSRAKWCALLAVSLGLHAALACSEKPFTNDPASGGSASAAAGRGGGGNSSAKGGQAVNGGRSTSGGAAGANGGAGPGGGAAASGGTRASGGVAQVAGAAGSAGDAAGGAEDGGAGGRAATAKDAYSSAIRGARPLVYWRMGISSGLIVPDDSGHGNDLVLQGTGHGLSRKGALAAGDDGAIRFDGEASFAIATDARALDFANGAPFSLEAWARRERGGSSYFQHLLSNTVGTPGERNGFMLYTLPEPGGQDAARSAFEYDSPGSEAGLWGPLPPESTWAHYVAVHDGRKITLYVDATLSDSVEIQGAMSARTGVFSVARASNGGQTFFKGELDELAIYARALPLSEVVSHFALGTLAE